jgi:hypothetical protein
MSAYSDDVSYLVECLPVQVILAASVHAGWLPAWLMLAALITASIQSIHMKLVTFMVINRFNKCNTWMYLNDCNVYREG